MNFFSPNAVTQLFNLNGLKALVTGGNSGIGKAMAYALGLSGAQLLLVARREPELEKVTKEMHSYGIQASWIATDLAVFDNIKMVAKKAETELGKIDIIINAAGVNLRQKFTDVTSESWDMQLSLHLKTPFFLTQLMAPSMKASGWGRIINIASLQSYRAFADSAPYGAAKGGIVQLTRAIAQEWSRYGITCNAIGPGFFPTNLTSKVFSDPSLVTHNAEQTCIGRNGKLEDLYGVTIFLCSKASDYITGQTIMVDGGFTAK